MLKALQINIEIAMEKWRGERLVVSGDGKARTILIANWKSSLATGNLVAN